MQTRPSTPMPPPPWATNTVTEDGWITHETVSMVQPKTVSAWPPIEPAEVQPTQISISVVDRLVAGRWVRSAPTVQVEGGAYPLTEISELVRAVLDVARLSGNAPAA